MSRRAIPILGLLTLLYAIISLAWSSGFSPWTIGLLGSLVVSFTLGYKTPDAFWIWLVYCCGMVWLILFQSINPILGSNTFGCLVAMAIAGAVAYHLWAFIPIGIFGLWLSNSRAAMLASAIVALIILWRRYPVSAIVVSALGCVYILTIDKSGPADSLAARLGIWQDTINHLTFFGSGWGSFATDYASWPVWRNNAGALAPHAYNDVLELTYELGIGIIPLWLMIILSLEASGRTSLVLLSFFIMSLFFFPLYIIPVGQLFAMSLGNHARERTTNGQMALTPAALSKRSWFGMGIQRS